MTQPNTITDIATTLNLFLFRGNDFERVFTLPVDVTPPATVATKLYTARSGRLLSTQPAISIAGQDITLTYENTETLPESCFHEILFDGRIVWAGVVTVTKNTSLTQVSPSGIVLLRTEPTVTVSVAYTVGGGSDGLPTYELPLTNMQHIVVTHYDHQLPRIRGVTLYRTDGQRLAIGYSVAPNLTIDIQLFRPTSGKLLIF